MTYNPQVYVVDDGADYRFIAQQVFQRFLPQYSVRFFSDGDDLRQLIQNKIVTDEPGLILVDFHMPGLNGLQTITYVKQQSAWSHVPIVLMSYESSQDEMSACYEAGASSVMIKPTDLIQLRDVLQSVCQHWLDNTERYQA